MISDRPPMPETAHQFGKSGLGADIGQGLQSVAEQQRFAGVQACRQGTNDLWLRRLQSSKNLRSRKLSLYRLSLQEANNRFEGLVHLPERSFSDSRVGTTDPHPLLLPASKVWPPRPFGAATQSNYGKPPQGSPAREDQSGVTPNPDNLRKLLQGSVLWSHIPSAHLLERIKITPASANPRGDLPPWHGKVYERLGIVGCAGKPPGTSRTRVRPPPKTSYRPIPIFPGVASHVRSLAISLSGKISLLLPRPCESS